MLGMIDIYVLRTYFDTNRTTAPMQFSDRLRLVFFEVRLISGVFGLDDKGDAVGELVVWICLAFAIFFADVVLQIQESWRWRSTAVKAQMAAA